MTKIKQQIINFLVFTRFINGDGCLSITNIACIIVLYKIATSPATNIMDAGSLLIALSHYGYKKYLNSTTISQASTVATQITTKIDAIASESDSSQ